MWLEPSAAVLPNNARLKNKMRVGLIMICACVVPCSCSQQLSDRTLTEISHERGWPVGSDDKQLPNNPEREKEFKIFWKGFRQDVLRENWDRLSSRVLFPLKTRATLDFDPVIEIKEEEFERVFTSFLAGENTSSFGASEETLIRELRSPNPYIVDDWVRIGDMEFVRTDKGWKLYWIYFDYSK